MTQTKQKLQSGGSLRLTSMAFAFFLGGLVGWSVHYWTIFRTRPVGPSGYIASIQSIRVESDVARFKSLAAAFRTYLRENGGWIPADPYRGMVESGKVSSFQDFVNAKVSFDFTDLPVRVETTPENNAPGVLFTAWMDYLDEIWICYADGTWARYSSQQASGITEQWHAEFRRAGMPTWGSVAEKAKWIENNKDKLVWSPEKKMYLTGRGG